MELPQDFTRRIRSQLGDACDDFLACYEKERAYGLRCNPLKIEEKKLRSVLLEKQIETEQVPWAAEGFYYSKVDLLRLINPITSIKYSFIPPPDKHAIEISKDKCIKRR